MIMQTAEILDEATGWERSIVEEPLAFAETILLVEDEQFVREVTSEVLRSAGYVVLAARNAVEAMCVYERIRGNMGLLLTDVVLPGESGQVLAGRMRRGNPDLKVLFVTGYPESIGMAERAHEQCLAKPFSTGVLLRRVRQVLDGDETVERQTRAS
jgi:two-component system, cell cycle sensor histidine kinase and response regulator CckA